MKNYNYLKFNHEEVFTIKKKVFLVFLSLLMCLSLSGCFWNQDNNDSANVESQKEPVKNNEEESMYDDYSLDNDGFYEDFEEDL